MVHKCFGTLCKYANTPKQISCFCPAQAVIIQNFFNDERVDGEMCSARVTMTHQRFLIVREAGQTHGWCHAGLVTLFLSKTHWHAHAAHIAEPLEVS